MSIIITGSTKGIGNALAHQFAAEGHDLITIARSQSDLDFHSKQLYEAYGLRSEERRVGKECRL